jgi:hypothetical protein
MKTSTIGATPRPAPGFTPSDLAALNDLGAAAIGQQRWSKCQVINEPFADYLAAWAVDVASSEPPNLGIARFKRTGTYALILGSLVVATAPSLNKILPAIWHTLASAGPEDAAIA